MARHAASLLERDQEVCLQDKKTKRWDIRAWVRHRRPHGRSYILETEGGSCFLRNRKFIKPIKAQDASDPAEGELDPSLEHATSTRRRAIKTADSTGASSGQPGGRARALGVRQ